MKKNIILLGALVALAGCAGGNKYEIVGSFPETVMAPYAYLLNAEDAAVIDSAAIVNGKFDIKGVIPEGVSMAYVLDASDTRMATIGAALFLEPGKITIASDEQLGLVATGTKGNDAQVEFTKAVEMIEDEDEFMAVLVESATKNAGTVFGLDQLANALMYKAIDADEAQKLYDKLPEKLKSNKTAKGILEQIEIQQKIGVGKPYIDFAHADILSGEPRSLKSVVETPGNKYVLLDFWASWCGPCMAELPYLSSAYDQFKDKGFEIFGCSLDRDHDSWMMAVVNMEMKWIHVSDLKYWECEGAALYGVRSIPANFLIDCSTGLIVASNLRGEKLVEKMAELCGE